MKSQQLHINLTVPSGWHELSEKQLRYVFQLIAADISSAEIAFTCLISWSGLKILGRQENGNRLMQLGKDIFEINAVAFAELLTQIDWVSKIPSFPVRLEKIGGATALTADFQGVPFQTYIICDNLYQGYLHTQSDEIINELAQQLYPQIGKHKLDAVERISVFYWFASLKSFFSLRFKDFLQPIADDSSNLLASQNIGDILQESMDAQIRALTKGDITKESEILSLDTWRALTELNAQAREYKEIQSQIKH